MSGLERQLGVFELLEHALVLVAEGGIVALDDPR